MCGVVVFKYYFNCKKMLDIPSRIGQVGAL